MSIRERTTNRKRGHRAWLFAWQMDEKFGADLGQQLRDSKLLDEMLCKKEVRYYPGLQPSEQSRQFLTLVDDSEEHIEEEEIDRLFQAVDASSLSSSSSSKQKKPKKTPKGAGGKEKGKKEKKKAMATFFCHMQLDPRRIRRNRKSQRRRTRTWMKKRKRGRNSSRRQRRLVSWKELRPYLRSGNGRRIEEVEVGVRLEGKYGPVVCG